MIFFFLEDTSYARDGTARRNWVPDTYVRNRIATFFPGSKILYQPRDRHGPFDAIIIGFQPGTNLWIPSSSS